MTIDSSLEGLSEADGRWRHEQICAACLLRNGSLSNCNMLFKHMAYKEFESLMLAISFEALA